MQMYNTNKYLKCIFHCDIHKTSSFYSMHYDSHFYICIKNIYILIINSYPIFFINIDRFETIRCSKQRNNSKNTLDLLLLSAFCVCVCMAMPMRNIYEIDSCFSLKAREAEDHFSEEYFLLKKYIYIFVCKHLGVRF